MVALNNVYDYGHSGVVGVPVVGAAVVMMAEYAIMRMALVRTLGPGLRGHYWR